MSTQAFSKRKSISFICSIVIFLFFSAALAIAQTTAFTYQGKLTDNGTLANGQYDLQVKLFDALTDGTQQGTTLTLSNVTVANGAFTVQLDFGACASCFNGAARFLEVAVKRTTDLTFVTLTPRQPVGSTPYAIKTRDLSFNGAYNDGVGTVLAASNTFTGESAGVNTTPDPALNNPAGKLNSFYGSGAGQANTTGIENAFFGTQAGQVNTTGFTNAFFGARAGNANTTGDSNAFFGASAGYRNTTGQNNTFIGYGADVTGSNPTGGNNTLLGFGTRVSSGVSNGTAIGAFAQVTQSDSLILGFNANVGIGTTAPVERLHVEGNGLFTGNLTVNGTLSAGSVSAASISGVVGVTNGGTGLSAAGAAGNFLRSDGTSWTSAAILPADLPAGNGNYVQNGTMQQASVNFNISGNGTAGGTLSGSIVNAATQYNLNGLRAFTMNGPYNDGGGTVFTASNTFTGDGAGVGTIFDPSPSSTIGKFNAFYGAGAGNHNALGRENSFFGTQAGQSSGGDFNTFVGRGADFSAFNTGGSNNTLLGYLSRVTANLTNATAIGSRAAVTQSNSLVLGGITGVNGGTSVNVGIGTSAPAARLEVRADSVNLAENTATFSAPNLGANLSHIHYGTTGDWYIRSASSTGKVILQDSGGNVGIGTTAPNSKLHVSGTGVIRARVDSDSNAGFALTLSNQPKWSVATVTGGNFQIFNDAIGSNALWINSTNNFVGIGTAAPDQLLAVNGNASKIGGGSWATFSDERLKNIRGRYTRGLQAVMQLQPIRYEYKPDNALGLRGAGEYVGFSAQEVQRILPEAVSRSTSGYLQINNDPILWTMLNAVKEQQAQIASQQAQLKQQTEHMQLQQRLIELQQQQFNQQQQRLEALQKLVCSTHRKAKVCN